MIEVRGRGALALAGLIVMSSPLGAGADEDWPRLWGPKGDARFQGESHVAQGESPKARELWRRPIGSGFSGISVVAGRGYTGESDGSQDHAVAFDVATGRELWRTPLGPTYRGHDGSRDGPISTPAVAGQRVFLVSAHGVLFALEAPSGRKRWQRDLKAEDGAAEPSYGFATSPLVVEDRVIVQAGGDKRPLLALEAVSGRLLWSVSHSKGPTYASPLLGTLAGKEQVIVMGNDLLYGVKVEDGALLWSHPTGAQGDATRSPLLLGDDRVLLPSWEEAKLVKVSAKDGTFSVAELWRSPRLKSSFSPTVFHRGHLFGLNTGYLVCLDPASGDVRWRQKVYPGSLILVDGHLVILGAESGDVRVAEASPEGYREKLRVPVFNAGATSSTGPTFAGGKLFLRNVEEIVALEVP
jgi:outer membrane protein assembly factor BamB